MESVNLLDSFRAESVPISSQYLVTKIQTNENIVHSNDDKANTMTNRGKTNYKSKHNIKYARTPTADEIAIRSGRNSKKIDCIARSVTPQKLGYESFDAYGFIFDRIELRPKRKHNQSRPVRFELGNDHEANIHNKNCIDARSQTHTSTIAKELQELNSQVSHVSKPSLKWGSTLTLPSPMTPGARVLPHTLSSSFDQVRLQRKNSASGGGSETVHMDPDEPHFGNYPTYSTVTNTFTENTPDYNYNGSMSSIIDSNATKMSELYVTMEIEVDDDVDGDNDENGDNDDNDDERESELEVVVEPFDPEHYESIVGVYKATNDVERDLRATGNDSYGFVYNYANINYNSLSNSNNFGVNSEIRNRSVELVAGSPGTFTLPAIPSVDFYDDSIANVFGVFENIENENENDEDEQKQSVAIGIISPHNIDDEQMQHTPYGDSGLIEASDNVDDIKSHVNNNGNNDDTNVNCNINYGYNINYNYNESDSNEHVHETLKDLNMDDITNIKETMDDKVSPNNISEESFVEISGAFQDYVNKNIGSITNINMSTMNEYGASTITPQPSQLDSPRPPNKDDCTVISRVPSRMLQDPANCKQSSSDLPSILSIMGSNGIISEESSANEYVNNFITSKTQKVDNYSVQQVERKDSDDTDNNIMAANGNDSTIDKPNSPKLSIWRRYSNRIDNNAQQHQQQQNDHNKSKHKRCMSANIDMV